MCILSSQGFVKVIGHHGSIASWTGGMEEWRNGLPFMAAPHWHLMEMGFKLGCWIEEADEQPLAFAMTA